MNTSNVFLPGSVVVLQYDNKAVVMFLSIQISWVSLGGGGGIHDLPTVGTIVLLTD